MYQAGIKKISLYENDGIKFYHFNPLDKQDITDLSSSGAIVVIENNQQPSFDCKLAFSNQGELTFSYSLEFFLYGYFSANLGIINQLKRSIYGWCMLVEFYDGTFKFFNNPIYFRQSEIKPHSEMAINIKASTAVPTRKVPMVYTPGISTIKVFRADTTILSADNDIYTADYAL